MKTAILILTEHQTPENRGRMAHALNLAGDAKRAGLDLRVIFAGKSVEWLPQFLDPNREEAHPFVKHYGHRFDDIRDHVITCNFCNIRFKTMDAVQGHVPVHGEGSAHMDQTWLLTEGWNVITI
ncbi:MAG: hypothetical protein KDA24_19700 [Deltaproteobacteria bacterium]|nr:hypothetical protein [Deltaproteobacteria bacterium]